MREPSEDDRKKVGKITVTVSHAVMSILAIILQTLAIIGFVNEGLTLAPILRQAGAIIIAIILLVSFIQDRKALNEGDKNS